MKDQFYVKDGNLIADWFQSFAKELYQSSVSRKDRLIALAKKVAARIRNNDIKIEVDWNLEANLCHLIIHVNEHENVKLLIGSERLFATITFFSKFNAIGNYYIPVTEHLAIFDKLNDILMNYAGYGFGEILT